MKDIHQNGLRGSLRAIIRALSDNMTPSFPEYATVRLELLNFWNDLLPSLRVYCSSSGLFLAHRANYFDRRIINSRLFKFIVGETIDGTSTEFLVHEEAIARLSQPLHSLMKGDLSEAQAGCAIWKDTSKETFERFVQVAYTGDYSIPNTREWDRVAGPENVGTDALGRRSPLGSSEEVKASEPKEQKPTQEEYDSLEELQNRGRSTKEKKKKGKKTDIGSVDWGSAFSRPVADEEPEQLPESSPVFRARRDKYPEPPSPSLVATSFRLLRYPLLTPCNIHLHTCEPAKHFEPDRSYSNVFLAHASLYVLGDFWLSDSLKALALHKLHKTLCIFQLDDENIKDIIDLARYAYKEEGKGFEKGIGGLRSMVCQYMVLNAAVLSPYTEFTELLAEGGQFVTDFFKFVIPRMR